MGENGYNTNIIHLQKCLKLKAGTARLMSFVPGSTNIIPGEGQDVKD